MTAAPHVLACVREIDHAALDARLHGAALDWAATQSAREPRNLHASELYGCLRKQGYALLSYDKTDRSFNPDSELAASAGDTIHARLQAWMQIEAHGLVYTLPDGRYALELPLDDESIPAAARALTARHRLSGRIDAVIRVSQGRLAICDIKTVDARKIDPGYPWLDDLLAKYAAQIMAYMHFWAAPDGERAYIGYIYMIRRDKTSVRRLFEVTYDPVAFDAELVRLAAAARALEADELPVAEPGRGICRFCAYRSQCDAWKEATHAQHVQQISCTTRAAHGAAALQAPY